MTSISSSPQAFCSLFRSLDEDIYEFTTEVDTIETRGTTSGQALQSSERSSRKAGYWSDRY